MSSTLNYHSSRSRASGRLDRVRTELDRSSAYITGSRNSSYEPLKRESSFSDSAGRVGRVRTRDRSADFSAKYRRSGSLELSAPPLKLRTRDRSSDFSINGIDRISNRPARTTLAPSAYEAKELKDLTSNPDSYLTLQKYANYDRVKEINSMVEEERRSKSYAKIINSSSSFQQDHDASRACMADIFMNTGGFSAKTVSAIAKEVIYKDEKGPKNYGWRKDMESYEDKLEVLNAHKRVVHESTKATRDVYKSTDSKIKDYDRESRRNTESSEPIKLNLTNLTPASTLATSSYSPSAVSRPEYTSTNQPSRNGHDSEPTYKKGSWRKDVEKYESDLTLKKVQEENKRKLETYDQTSTRTPFQHEHIPSNNSGESKSFNAQTKTAKVEILENSVKKNGNTTNESKYESKYHDIHTTRNSKESGKRDIPAVSEFGKSKIKHAESSSIPSLNKDELIVESKSPPLWQKPVTMKKEEPAIEEAKSAHKWKTPEVVMKKDPKVEETKPVPKWKAETVKEEEPKVEEEKPVPKWKKPVTVKKEEPKVGEEKPVPKWKKAETVKEEEPKVEEEKSVPKWKKAETVKKEEQKVEEEKPVPKWKKPVTVKKEEPKVEEEKPVPKWKKPVTVKKEEPKVEEKKPVPKWKKPVTLKKEEPKVEETKLDPKSKKEEPKVVEEKSVPKWKKPVTVKKEEPKVVEEKSVPKWKKPETVKKEEPKVEEEKPVPKWKKPVTVKKEEYKIEEPKPKSEEVAEKAPEPKEIDTTDPSTLENNQDVTKGAENDESEEKKAEEEDVSGMRAMRKETDIRFASMEAEFEEGRSKLSALRAKMKRLREAAKAQKEADAAEEASKR